MFRKPPFQPRVMMSNPKQRVKKRNHLDLTDYNDEPALKSKDAIESLTQSSLYQQLRWKQLLVLYIIAFWIIYYFERLKPYFVIKSCMWDNWEDWPTTSSPYHSIIIGDAQIVDPNSYPNSTRIRLELTRFFSDNYLHRNYNIYTKLLKPDSIVFVGDLFDGGREWNDTEWISEYKRFNKIFNQVKGVQQFRQVPGNHDIGFGNDIDFERYSRFKAFFGNGDEVITIGNHSLVLLDTVSLSCHEDKRVSRTPREFLNSFRDTNPYMNLPRIVVSHVPMYRFTELQTCGPLRESKKPFPVARGKQYQTVLEYDMSQEIVNYIKPSIIFSGDDHDYCHVRYPFDKQYSRNAEDYEFHVGEVAGEVYSDEITVKSSSMTSGIKRPAIQLLSLWNPEDNTDIKTAPGPQGLNTVHSGTASTHLCYLPSPYQPLWHYIIYTAFSTFWIFICTVKVQFGRQLNSSLRNWVQNLKKVACGHLEGNNRIIDKTSQRENISLMEKFIDFTFLDWNVETISNPRKFYVNSVVSLSLFYVTLYIYFSLN